MKSLKTKLSTSFFKPKYLVELIKKRYFSKISDPKELRKWAGIYAFSNIVTTILFFLWWIDIRSINKEVINYLFLTSIVIHLLIASRFIKSSQQFSKSAFTKWAWINLIFISPIGGLILLYYVCFKKYWILENNPTKIRDIEKELEQEGEEREEGKEREESYKETNTTRNFDYKKLEARFNYSLSHLKKINERKTKEILQNILQIKNYDFEELDFFQINTVIALSNVLKEFKQKNFDNLIWGAHWYEDNFFTFGLKNTQPISMHNKHLMLVGSIVLDNMHNHKEILEKKIQIKKNLTFSDAKTISLHLGERCKWYINQ